MYIHAIDFMKVAFFTIVGFRNNTVLFYHTIVFLLLKIDARSDYYSSVLCARFHNQFLFIYEYCLICLRNEMLLLDSDKYI